MAGISEQGLTELYPILIAAAREAGFPLAGALDLALAREAMAEHIARYDAWLRAGHAGAMSYLERGRDRRANPEVVFPGARSILCVASPYDARRPEGEARYARYIRGRDYHDVIAEKLETMMGTVAAAWAARGQPELKWKVCVDTSAVLERSWAALAGLGWIGKNTLLIHPKHGSYLFLAEVLINQETGKGPEPHADFCGSCTRCLQACPTDALKEPHLVKSTRCISYWTLEKRGELPISEADRRSMGVWIAGCDLCQEACPFNTKPARRAAESPASAHADALQLAQWRALLEETEEQYRARVGDSSLSRVKPPQFRRNLAIALANAASELPTSLCQSLLRLVKTRLEQETDEHARGEWIRCRSALEK